VRLWPRSRPGTYIGSAACPDGGQQHRGSPEGHHQVRSETRPWTGRTAH